MATSQPQSGRQPNCLKSAHTTELLRELCDRYGEIIFIGCKPITPMVVCHSADLIDVKTKLNPDSGIGSTLATILAKILAQLRSKQPQVSTPTAGTQV